MSVKLRLTLSIAVIFLATIASVVMAGFSALQITFLCVGLAATILAFISLNSGLSGQLETLSMYLIDLAQGKKKISLPADLDDEILKTAKEAGNAIHNLAEECSKAQEESNSLRSRLSSAEAETEKTRKELGEQKDALDAISKSAANAEGISGKLFAGIEELSAQVT